MAQLVEENLAAFGERARPNPQSIFIALRLRVSGGHKIWNIYPIATSSSLVRFTARRIAVIRHFYVTISIRRCDWRINVFYFPISRQLFVSFTFASSQPHQPAAVQGSVSASSMWEQRRELKPKKKKTISFYSTFLLRRQRPRM